MIAKARLVDGYYVSFDVESLSAVPNLWHAGIGEGGEHVEFSGRHVVRAWDGGWVRADGRAIVDGKLGEPSR